MLGGATVTEEIHPGYKVSTVRPPRWARCGPRSSRPWTCGTAGSTFVEPEPRVFAPPAGRARASRCGATPARTAFDLRTLSRPRRRTLPGVPPLARPPSSASSRACWRMTPPDIDQPVHAGPARRCWAGHGLPRPGPGGRASACCAGAPWRWPTSRRSGSTDDLLRAIVCARGIFGDLRRPVVGGHHRQPAAPGRGRGRQRRRLGGAGRRAGWARSSSALAGAARAVRRRDPHGRRGGARSGEGRPGDGRGARGRRGDRRPGRGLERRSAPHVPAPARSRASSIPTTCAASGTTARRAWPRR